MESNDTNSLNLNVIKPEDIAPLYHDICDIIDNERNKIASLINARICLTNWHIGKRINDEILFNRRADYGQKIVKKLSHKLTERYGKGWSEKKLRHCLRAAETFSEDEIITATHKQLSWTHLRTLMYIKNPTERYFYMIMCCNEHWDTRTLDDKIDKQLYLRTIISNNSEEFIKSELEKVKSNNQLQPDLVFRSSYFLDMLGLPDVFSEKELETAIINQIEEFIRELGCDFSFICRQKRITIDSTDYYIDLLFFNRELKRLIAIDLKLGKFKPEYEDQMLLYLRYLNRNERKEWEESPIGLILCSEGNAEHIEYLMLNDNPNIKVAQYFTKLPDKKILSEKLKKAIAIAKEYYYQKQSDKE